MPASTPAHLSEFMVHLRSWTHHTAAAKHDNLCNVFYRFYNASLRCTAANNIEAALPTELRSRLLPLVVLRFWDIN